MRGRLTEHEIESYLRDNGYPEHVCRHGSKGLIARWRKFVDEVEKGYKSGLEAYRNELELRGVISLIGLDEDVKDLDARFELLLTARGNRVWESAEADPFWDFGYPKNATGELLEDLRAEGLASNS